MKLNTTNELQRASRVLEHLPSVFEALESEGEVLLEGLYKTPRLNPRRPDKPVSGTGTKQYKRCVWGMGENVAAALDRAKANYTIAHNEARAIQMGVPAVLAKFAALGESRTNLKQALKNLKAELRRFRGLRTQERALCPKPATTLPDVESQSTRASTKGQDMANKKKVAKKTGGKKSADNVSTQDLLNQLAKSKDAVEKRNLRARLRSRGHTGGLGNGGGKKKSKKA